MKKIALFLQILLPVSLLVCIALFFGCNREQAPSGNDPSAGQQQQEEVPAPADLFLEKDYITSNKTKYTVRFNDVQGADGYVVNPGHKDFDIKETSLDVSEFVKIGNIQNITVKAYKEQDGKRIFSKETTITEKILRITQGVTYSPLEDGTYEVSCEKCSKLQITGTVMFPDRYNGKKITRLAENCFYRPFDSGEVVGYVDGKRVVSVRQFVNTATTEVIFPKYVTSFGPNAFYGCANLEQIEIPDTVREIGYQCFVNCSSLRSIRIPNGITQVVSFNGSAELTEVYLPSSVKLVSGFSDCPNLTKIEFPSSLETVDGFNNTGLTEVYLPPSVKSIGGFRDCKKLERINLENVTEIKYYSFYGSKWFEELTDEFVVIKGMMLRYNGEKEELYEYPSGIEEISFYCFGGEHGPKTIFLPYFGKKTEVSEYQFAGRVGDNEHLKHLIIDEGYEVLPPKATTSVKALESIVVPRTMKTMALTQNKKDCALLSSIYYMGTQEEWEKVQTDGRIAAITVYFYSETEPTEEGNFWHYINNEIVLW